MAQLPDPGPRLRGRDLSTVCEGVPMIQPSYSHAGIDLYTGDSLSVLRELPDGCAQCCVTSPPFFQLRNYGVDGQIGLEDAPSDYIARLVEVFAEVRRVLRPDGVMFVEIGDSYAGAGYSNHANTGGAQRADGGKQRHTRPGNPAKTQGAANRDGLGAVAGYKPKDLMGIPWRLAFALQDDGWLLRSDIVWARPNPMPESVTDRPTKAHSYVFLLARQARYAYYADAIAETAMPESAERYRSAFNVGAKELAGRGLAHGNPNSPGLRTFSGSRNARSVWAIPTEPTPFAHFATFPRELARRCILAGSAPGNTVLDPFSGAGTTALVAKTLGRKAIGIELNPAYVELSRKRVEEPLFEAAAEPGAPRAVQEALL